jgi:hypothetical protein
MQYLDKVPVKMVNSSGSPHMLILAYVLATIAFGI